MNAESRRLRQAAIDAVVDDYTARATGRLPNPDAVARHLAAAREAGIPEADIQETADLIFTNRIVCCR